MNWHRHYLCQAIVRQQLSISPLTAFLKFARQFSSSRGRGPGTVAARIRVAGPTVHLGPTVTDSAGALATGDDETGTGTAGQPLARACPLMQTPGIWRTCQWLLVTVTSRAGPGPPGPGGRHGRRAGPQTPRLSLRNVASLSHGARWQARRLSPALTEHGSLDSEVH
jgi:hypothetical protein